MKKRLLIILASLTIALTSYTKAECEEVHLEDIPQEYIVYAWECEEEFNISAALLLSLCWTESRFKESVVKGNVTQITNVKWFKEGIEVVCADDVKGNPLQNMKVCAYYLSKWANEYPGECYLWLDCWHEGYENAIRKYNGKGTYYSRTIDNQAQILEEELEVYNERKRP